MASLDFVKDCTEKLEKQGVDYLIITLREYKEKDLLDFLVHFKSDQARDKMIKILNEKITVSDS